MNVFLDTLMIEISFLGHYFLLNLPTGALEILTFYATCNAAICNMSSLGNGRL